ncbi:hypothetical protein BU16DRAFT_615918 [Lophium mytilinum]|uniref:Uncharacterized protein n=1 Tax=Lophium mytilinum TaxID=390894 RepID=A0A6A6R3Q7_9PEZI|nr:hypothetical protein BU16DRAFT_615918 [Lophium mytilinum]
MLSQATEAEELQRMLHSNTLALTAAVQSKDAVANPLHASCKNNATLLKYNIIIMKAFAIIGDKFWRWRRSGDLSISWNALDGSKMSSTPPRFNNSRAGRHLQRGLSDPPVISLRGGSGSYRDPSSSRRAQPPRPSSQASYSSAPTPAASTGAPTSAASTGASTPAVYNDAPTPAYTGAPAGHSNHALGPDGSGLKSVSNAPVSSESTPKYINDDERRRRGMEKSQEFSERFYSSHPVDARRNNRDYFTRSYATPPESAIDTSEDGNSSFFDRDRSPQTPDRVPSSERVAVPVIAVIPPSPKLQAEIPRKKANSEKETSKEKDDSCGSKDGR